MIVTIDSLKVVMDKYPNLTFHGLIERTEIKPIDYNSQRKELLECYGKRFSVTVKFVEQYLLPNDKFNRKHSTYGLKHAVENYIGYIPASILIAALLHLGYKYDPIKSAGCYAYFNILEKSIKGIMDKQGHPLENIQQEIKDWEDITQYRPWLK